MANIDDFIVFGEPDIQDSEIQEVIDCMHSKWLGTGPRVAQFERDFARYKNLDQNQVAALNSCTAALHVSMIAAGISIGDEVITTAMTFCATINAIIHAGGKPVLADINPDTLNIDPEDIEAKITSRTRAILPVHFAGRPCEMDVIMAIAAKHKLIVIEDCAHAIEAEWHGKPVGTFGDYGCFSFYVTKNIVTGEGGMVLAKTPEKISKIKILSLHGMSKDAWHRFGDEGYKHYFVTEPGFKYNMMDLQAAIGIHQLARIEGVWTRRRKLWALYQQEFADLPIRLPTESDKKSRHGYHLFTIQIDETQANIDRDEFLSAMTATNIGVGVHYLCIAEHPYYQEAYGWRPDDFPVAKRVGRQTVSLPFAPHLSNADVERIVEVVRDALVSRI